MAEIVAVTPAIRVRGRRGARWYVMACPPLLAIAGVMAWSYSLKGLRPYAAGAEGLAPQLSAMWWCALGFEVLAVLLALSFNRPRSVVMVPAVLGLVVVLHATLPAVEPAPRFDAAYTIAGFTQYVARTGTTLPRLDARMSWFGLFAGAGLIQRVIGVNAQWYLRWAPFVLELAYLVPVKALANGAFRSPRARWAAAPLFAAANWIDQDYFSPQAIALLLYLVVLVLATRVFAADGRQWPTVAVRPVRAAVTRLRLGRSQIEAKDRRPVSPPLSEKTRRSLFTTTVVTAATIAVIHQLTPLALAAVLFALALLGLTTLRRLWLIVAIVVAVWLSWFARPFWSGHLQAIFGSVGQVGGTLSISVAQRVNTEIPGRMIVQDLRVVSAGIICIAAAVGALSQWRRGRYMLVEVVLAVAPASSALLLAYGGEVGLRVLLYGLAPFSVLASAILAKDSLPRSNGSVSGLRMACFAMVFVALCLVFPFARYGNEGFEAISPAEVAAASRVYMVVPKGSLVEVLNRDEALAGSHDGVLRIGVIGTAALGSGRQLASTFPQRYYLFLTRSEEQLDSIYYGFPSGWLPHYLTELRKVRSVSTVFRTKDAVLLEVGPR